MTTALHYFFEHIVFFMLIIPMTNEFMFIFYPERSVSDNIKTDPFRKWLTIASFIVIIAGIFTAEGLLFFLYFFLGWVAYCLEKRWPAQIKQKWVTVSDGILNLILLLFIGWSHFYAKDPVINTLRDYVWA